MNSMIRGNVACLIAIAQLGGGCAKVDLNPTIDGALGGQTAAEGGATSGASSGGGGGGGGVAGTSIATQCDDPNEVAVKAITGLEAHYCLLTTYGAVRCWGDNYFGELGDGQTQTNSPTLTADVLTDVQAIAAGVQYTCALMKSGGIRCWGYGGCGEFCDDPLGLNHGIIRASPPQSDVAVDAEAIAAGFESTCALLVGGTVQCWGDITNCYSTTVLNGARAITVGSTFGCAIMNSGGVRCFGRSDLVVGSSGTAGTEVPVSGELLSDVKAIAASEGNFVCALTNSGGVRCWGSNSAGQLGDGTTVDRPSPPTSDVLTGVKAIGVGKMDACAVMLSGAVRCWGRDQPLIPATEAVDVVTGAQALALGDGSACALMSSGGVMCWLANSTPELVAGTCSN